MSIIDNFINEVKIITIEDFINLIIALMVIILFFMISRIVSYVIIKIFNFKEKDKKKIKENAFYKPISAFIRITGVCIGIMLLKLPDEGKVTVMKLYKIGIIICAANGFQRRKDHRDGAHRVR